MPTLGRKVPKQDLLKTIWSPSVYDAHHLLANSRPLHRPLACTSLNVLINESLGVVQIRSSPEVQRETKYLEPVTSTKALWKNSVKYPASSVPLTPPGLSNVVPFLASIPSSLSKTQHKPRKELHHRPTCASKVLKIMALIPKLKLIWASILTTFYVRATICSTLEVQVGTLRPTSGAKALPLRPAGRKPLLRRHPGVQGRRLRTRSRL